MDVDLGRRQSDALGLVHRLQHVGDQGLDAAVDCLHRAGDGVQLGIGITKNG